MVVPTSKTPKTPAAPKKAAPAGKPAQGAGNKSGQGNGRSGQASGNKSGQNAKPNTGNKSSGGFGGSSSKSKPQKTKESTKKQSMLNTHKVTPFKYDMRELLATTSMDPAKANSFLASVIAKASRVSTKDTKDFVKTYLDSGDLTKDEVDRIYKLLDRYSKWR